MARFTTGLLLGASASGIAYAVGASPLWTFLVGLVVAVLVWFGEFILDDLL
ncbi:hypothetical protein OOK27_05120 [Streptomyces canus]|uniref:hypothetical protein n=1 Tax=Streptomyces canus TaxID=58343 RepID=UPI00225AFFA8|nr:hypothetical protein [Streptomyces canus]MCX5253553.1 hypothetical protein [Streptomyces canus]